MTQAAQTGAGIFPRSVGFVGLGVMGVPMASHLVEAAISTKSKIHVFSRTRSRADGLVAAGAIWKQPRAG